MLTGEHRQADWRRVTRAHKCPVCGRDSWCTVSGDGMVAHCMRIQSDKPIAKGGWVHRLMEPLPSRDLPPKEDRRPKVKVDFAERAKSLFFCKQAPQARDELAAKIGVSVDSLERLRVGVGWDRGGRYFSFPERNARGRITGISRRYDDGRKKTMYGSKPGIYIAENWWIAAGPILIPEGGSDTAALLSMGLSALGRHNTSVGLDYIITVLRGADRPIVVIGERDEKPDRRGQPQTDKQCPADCYGCYNCWPGMAWARTCADRVSEALKVEVRWRMPPDGAKDIREWLNEHGRRYPATGFEFLQGMT